MRYSTRRGLFKRQTRKRNPRRQRRTARKDPGEQTEGRVLEVEGAEFQEGMVNSAKCRWLTEHTGLSSQTAVRKERLC